MGPTITRSASWKAWTYPSSNSLRLEEMERGSVPRLLRLIFRDSYLEYTHARPELRLPKPMTIEETRESLRTPPPWRKVTPAEAKAAKPKRPRISRYAEPEPSDRWKLR